MEILHHHPSDDPRALPLYSRVEAARLIGVSNSTMEGYVSPKVRDGGARTSQPIIKVPKDQGSRLSFNNLVEAYVLKLLRWRHDVSMQAVRRAADYAEKQMGIEGLLRRKELRLGKAGDLFWDHYLGELENLTRGGQLAMRKLVEDGLQRIDWDQKTSLPLRLFPHIAGIDPSKRSIVIDPSIAFGRPTITGKGLPTWAVSERIDAGETPEDVAEDYGITNDQLIDALIYEEAR